MKLRDLYIFPAFAAVMEQARNIENGTVNTGTAPGVMTYQRWLEWYEGVFTDIHIQKSGKVVYMDAESCDPKLNTKNEELLETGIPAGYWIYVHDSFDGMIFNQFNTYREALRAYKKIIINSIFHPEAEALNKYLFLYDAGDSGRITIGLKKYSVEGKMSKTLLPIYYRYIRNPIITPIRSRFNIGILRRKGKKYGKHN